MRTHKKGSFRLVHRNVWETVSKFGEGYHREALVIMYLETGPHSNYTGLFHASIVDISNYTCLTVQEVLQAIDNLSGWGLIVYDKDRQMVFVKGMLQRQLGTSTPNADNMKGVFYHIERMPEESLAVEAFISANRELPKIEDLYRVMYGGDDPGGVTGGSNQGGHPNERLETLDLRLETRDVKRENVIPQKASGTTLCGQPSSSTPESSSKPDGNPQINGSPIGSYGKPTPEKAKAKASGKVKPGNGHGKSDAQLKKKGLAIAKRKVASGEWDLSEASDKLRSEYGYTNEDINTREVSDALGLSQGAR